MLDGIISRDVLWQSGHSTVSFCIICGMMPIGWDRYRFREVSCISRCPFTVAIIFCTTLPAGYRKACLKPRILFIYVCNWTCILHLALIVQWCHYSRNPFFYGWRSEKISERILIYKRIGGAGRCRLTMDCHQLGKINCFLTHCWQESALSL